MHAFLRVGVLHNAYAPWPAVKRMLFLRKDLQKSIKICDKSIDLA
tara:strand:- start:864 stop:998 length:135 start_codon:yes stop_codon:yes gene_type:complete